MSTMEKYRVLLQLLLLMITVRNLAASHRLQGTIGGNHQHGQALPWNSQNAGCSLHLFNSTLTCKGPGVNDIPSGYPSTIIIIIFKNTGITSIPSKAFEKYPELGTITFTDNPIEKIDRDAFSGLLKLNSIDLSNNKLSDNSFDQEPFDGLSSLSMVTLNDNALATFPLHLFVNANKLAIFYVDNNKISNMGRTLDVTLTSITSIYLQYNQLQSVDAAIFTRMPKLETLDLRYNQISVIENPDTFMTMANLAELSLFDNSFHCDCEVSWILEAYIANKPWTNRWITIRCGSPEWMNFEDVLELDPKDLTCEVPDITPHTPTSISHNKNTEFTIKAILDRGFPYSTWVAPNGKVETDQRAPVSKHEMLWASAYSNVNSIDNTVMATLTIKKNFDDYVNEIGENKFTLIATNAAGNATLTFSVYISGAVCGPSVCMSSLLLLVITALVVTK